MPATARSLQGYKAKSFRLTYRVLHFEAKNTCGPPVLPEKEARQTSRESHIKNKRTRKYKNKRKFLSIIHGNKKSPRDKRLAISMFAVNFA